MKITKDRTELELGNHLWLNREDDVGVRCTLWHEEERLHVIFSVREAELRRMVWNANGPVWTDSCVEVFIRRAGADEYSNFEFSASGAFLAMHGEGRKDRVPYSDDERLAIRPSVRILENNNKTSLWELSCVFDLKRLGLVDTLPATLDFNLYKCGDGLKRPHYLSLFEVKTEEPDFHRPEFFGRMELC